jgi:hypothetical protein
MLRLMRKAGHRGPESASPSWDVPISALARRQHGVVSRAQFREIGLTDEAITKRAARGRLHGGRLAA